MKRVVLLFLSIIMILIGAVGFVACDSCGGEEKPPVDSTTPERNDTSTYKIEGEYIYFGTYPQTLKSDSVTVSEKPNSEGYYLGSDGEFYAKVITKSSSNEYKQMYNGQYVNYEFSNGKSIGRSVTYYFKVEPIKWRIVKSDTNKALLIADIILDAHSFNSSQNWENIDETVIYASNYEHSDLRKWLNQEFLDKAFTSKQQGLINTYAVDNSANTTCLDSNAYYSNTTFDKIFIFSYQDFISAAYGFNYTASAQDTNRIRVTTDYSRANGASMTVAPNAYGNGVYYLRSADKNEGSINVSTVYSNGNIYSEYVDNYHMGIVPSLLLQIKGNASNSQEECSHVWNDWVVSKEATCTVAGIKSRICSLCFKNDKDNSALGHSYNEEDAIITPATCLEEGRVDYTCIRCGVSTSETLDALGHSFTDYVETPATCTENAYKTATCDRCDQTDTITEENSKLGHTYGTDGKCIRCSLLNPELKVNTLEITNENKLLEVGVATQITYRVTPANAIYETVAYRMTENTCNATLTEEGLLTCGKVGSVTVAVTIDGEITTKVKFYVPQHVSTPEEFFEIRNDLSGVYLLENDIDLSGYSAWTPIGYATKTSTGSYDYVNAFSGMLDGNGYTISGLNINLEDENTSSLLTVGLFGSLSREGQVKNVVVEGANVTGRSVSTTEYVGILVGFNPGTVDNADVSGTIDVQDVTYVGGAIGENIGLAKAIKTEIDITLAGNKEVKNSYYVGGVVSRSAGGQIEEISVVGSIKVNISSNTAYIGGAVGALQDKLAVASVDVDVDATINYSKSDGKHSYIGVLSGYSQQALSGLKTFGHITVNSMGNAKIGGIAGEIQADITDSENNASISITKVGDSYSSSINKSYVGGIVGQSNKIVENCVNNGAINIDSIASGYVGGVAGDVSNSEPDVAYAKKVNNCAPILVTVGRDILYFGGVIGYTNKLDTATNIAPITVKTVANATNYVGGVAGYVKGSTTNAVNYENATLTATNSQTGGTNTYHSIGGVLGYSLGSVEKLYNYADLNVNTDAPLYFGGVVGYISDVSSKIENYGNSIIVSMNSANSYNSYVGGVVGYSTDNITDTYNTANISVKKGTVYVGGIVGYNSGTTSDSTSTANVYVDCSNSGYYYGNYPDSKVGGIVGGSNAVTDCFATGDSIEVIGSSSANVYVGGVVGNASGAITNVYSYPNIQVTEFYQEYVGGVAGYAGNISKSYSVSNITAIANGYEGELYAGGIAGEISGSVSECYANGDVDCVGQYNVYAGGLIGNVIRYSTVSDSYTAYGYTRTNSSMAETEKTLNIFNGGLVGRNYGTIQNCYTVSYNNTISNGSSNKHMHYIGGLVGQNSGTVLGSFVLDARDKIARPLPEMSTDVLGSGVASAFYAGGFVGYNAGTVTNCYSYASVSTTVADAYTGGFVGMNANNINYAISYGAVNAGIQGDKTGGFAGGGTATYVKCFFSSEDANQPDDSNTQEGITANTKSALTTATTFDGFDTASWNIVDGLYPTLIFGDVWESRSDTFNKYNMLVNVSNDDKQYTFPHNDRVSVSFETGTEEVLEGIAVNKDDKISLPTPSTMYTLLGATYTFIGWATDAEKTNILTSRVYTVTETTTLYAKYCQNVDIPTAVEYQFDGTEKSVSSLYYDTNGYTVEGTLSATKAGEYTVTFKLNDGYCWTDASTADFEIKWKIINAAVLACDTVTVVKDTDELSAEFFNASAIDSDETDVPVRVEILSGEFLAGEIVTVKVSAKVGNIQTYKEFDIKVYGQPVITYSYSNRFLPTNQTVEYWFTVKDSFGYTISDAEFSYDENRVEGTALTVTVSATDPAGNTVEETFNLHNGQHVYSSETIPAVSCAENGYDLFTCACGESYKDNYTFIPHNYGTDNTCDDCNYTSTVSRINSYGEADPEGNYVLFGSYPQSQVTDNTLTNTLMDGITYPTVESNAGWISYGYYANGEVQDFMWYKDVEYEESKYRAVYFTSYRPYYTTYYSSANNSYQDNYYYTGNVYWFKFEPIKWRILETDGSVAKLFAELILDAQQYDYDGTYNNSYEESTIRAWLNDSFYNTAFSTAEKAAILLDRIDNSSATTCDTTYQSGDTSDNVTLLSYQEATSSAYGFNSSSYRRKSSSAYAKCQGVADTYWITRSPYSRSNTCSYFTYSGSHSYVDLHYLSGIVPSIQIALA